MYKVMPICFVNSVCTIFSLTLFLPGEGGISPLIVYHVTKSVRNRAKELFTDYQTFYTINLLLNKELLPIQEMPKLGISEHKIVKTGKEKWTLGIFCTILEFFGTKKDIILEFCAKSRMN